MRPQCLSAKARHLAQYEMEDPRVMKVVVSLMGWEFAEYPLEEKDGSDKGKKMTIAREPQGGMGMVG